jgi:hypothetical protein
LCKTQHERSAGISHFPPVMPPRAQVQRRRRSIRSSRRTSSKPPTKASPQGPKREMLPKQTSGHCGTHTHAPVSSAKARITTRWPQMPWGESAIVTTHVRVLLHSRLVLNHKVLCGVLYPEAHNNGLQKKKNRRGVIRKCHNARAAIT